MRLPAVLVMLVLTLGMGACGGVRPEHVDDGSPRSCDAPKGSPIDVATEPDWRFGRYHDWSDRNDCLVRIDVVTDRPGPDHCQFQAARVIAVGNPIGTRFTSAADTIEYVRDPEGVFGVPALTEGLDLDAELPVNAADTGFRQAATELWVVPDDTSAIYLRRDDRVERWPAGVTPRCA